MGAIAIGRAMQAAQVLVARVHDRFNRMWFWIWSGRGAAFVLLQVGTTVSPTYAAEVSGHPSVAPHMNKFFGIINGIDMDIWDPQSDQFLPR